MHKVNDDIAEIEQKIENIETDVLMYIEEKMNNILENEHSKEIEEKNTEELWNILQDIKDAHIKKGIHGSIEEQEYSREMARKALKVIKMQAKKREKLTIKRVEQYCKVEDFLFILKDELINIAQKEKDKKALNIAKKLNRDNVNSIDLWQKITKIDDIDIPKEENYALVVVKQNNSILQFIKEKFSKQDIPRTTMYTFGDINPRTLEWENIEIIVDKFPRKFSNKQTKRLLAIEINDVPKVKKEHEIGKYPNLQTITFGRNVKSIGENVLSYRGSKNHIKDILDLSSLSKNDYNYIMRAIEHHIHFHRNHNEGKECYSSLVKEIKISDSVENLEKEAFSNLPELQKISFGNGILEIPDCCCEFCDNLTEINFSDNLKKIGIAAFRQFFGGYTILPNCLYGRDANLLLEQRKTILEKYKEIYHYQNKVKFPKDVLEIGDHAFQIYYRDYEESKGKNKMKTYSLVFTKEQMEKFGNVKDINAHNILIENNDALGDNLEIEDDINNLDKKKVKIRKIENKEKKGDNEIDK